MAERINTQRFAAAHAAFLEHLHTQSGGVPFTRFDHPFLLKNEISYKLDIYARASQALLLDKWPRWKPGAGRIRNAVREACRPELKANWLEHRYGPHKNSASPVYLAEKPEQVEGLEKVLYDFFLGGPSTPDALGPRFDRLASYLRTQQLGCKWPFLAHLAFLLRPQTYFPIHPGKFEKLLHFYGVEVRIVRKVQWDVYRTLLDVADELKERLALYERPNAVEVQSYMYVVAQLLDHLAEEALSYTPTVDFEQEMNRRKRRAEERERIGLLGERYVLEEEQRRLTEAKRPDLARQVRLIAVEDERAGYDVCSLDLDGTERHIEVKTTARSCTSDQGFWLTENEKQRAQKDEQWHLYRVWEVNSIPHYRDLGNLVLNANPRWEINPASWFVSPIG